MKQRLHFILLGVQSVSDASRFYDALGWQRASDSHAGFVKYNLGGYCIALISKDDLAKDALFPSSEGSGFPGAAFVHLVKTEKEVAQTLEKAVKAGGTLVKPATVTPYGVAGYFKDPDGHLFEVDYEEKFRFDEKDQLITE